MARASPPCGSLALDRPKAGHDVHLPLPSVARTRIGRVGMLLCREVFCAPAALRGANVVVNPIGVGMFSEDQFTTWTERAHAVALSCAAPVVGTSHADGRYKDAAVSLPLAFAFAGDGRTLALRRCDPRPVVVDTPSEGGDGRTGDPAACR